jgi:hypothetical protein
MPPKIGLIEHLGRRGLTPMQAHRWLAFITVALDILGEAAAAVAQPTEWQKLAMKAEGRNIEEPDITTELYARMKQLQESSTIESARRELHINCEDPVDSRSRAGKSARAADFVLSTLRYQSALRFVLEAKLLRKKADIKAIYLGPDGLGCFTTSDSPYSTHLMAGMLGYTRTLTEVEWSAHLNEAISEYDSKIITGHGSVELPIDGREYIYCDVDRATLKLEPLFLLHKILSFPE